LPCRMRSLTWPRRFALTTFKCLSLTPKTSLSAQVGIGRGACCCRHQAVIVYILCNVHLARVLPHLLVSLFVSVFWQVCSGSNSDPSSHHSCLSVLKTTIVLLLVNTWWL
jgi:hypothetical protein